MKSLIAAGDLAHAGQAWVHAPVVQWRVPRSVQDAVQRRAERLSATAARVLRLAAVASTLRDKYPTADLISAGMSADLEQAVAFGATHVRIGSALLGNRPALR